MALPVGLEDHLSDTTGVCPASRDHLCAFGRAAVQEHHVGVFRMGGIEDGPDQVVSLIVPARERDPRTFGAVHLGLLAALGGKIGPAVHHGGSQSAMRDLGSGAGQPGRTGGGREVVHGQIAHLLEGVAMVPEFKPDHLEALEFDRGDLGAVLDRQTFPDLEFVVVEKLLDMGQPAMEDRGQGP